MGRMRYLNPFASRFGGDVRGKALVGFAHAATDGAMVATVDVVVVREDARGAGVGEKLVRRLGEELCARDIYDVGVRAPRERRAFFARCGFGPDAEGATLMALPPGGGGGGGGGATGAKGGDRARELAKTFTPERTLKNDGAGLREMMLREMRDADGTARAG